MYEQNTAQLIKKSLIEIKRLKRKLKNQNKSEAVAIIGMACRFPGGSDSPDKYWDLLKNGLEGLRDVPENRWNAERYFDETPGKPSKIYTQKLNFLAEDVSLFDPRLFVISPREAEEMDPQQRLLLELSWEALERSGSSPKSLKGQSVGVFMGIITSEYALLPRDLKTTGPHTMTGLLNSMASGRIAHAFGFHGPAVSVDTACSSSMVSIHQACKSIRDNDCHTALAGGAGIMLSPLPMLNLCKLRALSKDGRCKTFSAKGDGYGRGEGAGVLVLKRLDLAQQDGDPILAVIETSSLNHDGASSGLTVPNGKAQQKLLEETLSRANITPNDIGYVELHGTGTSLGDPIEYQSLVGVFGKNRSQQNPLMLGACKANIGHLEAAAGIASVIKTVLCLHHKAIPPHINCDEINPRIDLTRIPAILPEAYHNWKTYDGNARRVGISSFGFSGTNAFMVIKEPPLRDTGHVHNGQDRNKHVLTVTAQSKAALNELANRYIQYIKDPSNVDLPSFAYTVNVGRSHFSWRAACVWSNKNELLDSLSSILNDSLANSNAYYQASSVDSEKKITMIFPGEMSGSFSQLATLIESCSRFRKTWQQCEDAFTSYFNTSMKQLILKPSDYFKANLIENAAVVFSASYCFFDVFAYLGIKLNTVYSEGEGIYAMAASTGLLSLQQSIDGLMAGYNDKNESKIETSKYQFTMPKIRVMLPGSNDPIKRSQLSDSTLLDCATNSPVDNNKLQELLGSDVIIYELNIEPNVINRISAAENNRGLSGNMTNYSWETIIDFLSLCYSHGHTIKWDLFDEGFSRQKLNCPTYPFQRRSYWIDTTPETVSNLQLASHHASVLKGPFDGRILSTPLNQSTVLFDIGPEKIPTLIDTHNIVHIGHYFEMLVSGLKKLNKNTNHIQFLTFDFALIVADNDEKEVQLIFQSSIDNLTNFSFHAEGKHAGDWNQHVHGAISDVPTNNVNPKQVDITTIQSRCSQEMLGSTFYENMEKKGVVLGTSVQWVDQIWYSDGEALSKFRLESSDELSASYERDIHPGLWASCFQLLHATLDGTVSKDVRFVLVGMKEIDFFETDVTPNLWCHVSSLGHPDKNGELDGSFTLFTDAGNVVAQCHGCIMKEQPVEKEDISTACQGDPEIVSSLTKARSPDHQLEMIIGYIKEILCELLKVPEEEIGVSESINQLGMDSLVGFELRDKINKQFGVPIAIPTLLQGPTPKELAQEIQLDIETKTNKFILETESDLEGAEEFEVITFPTYENISMEKHKWVPGNHSDSDGIQLFCLPYGGGSASIYKNWRSAFPDEISVRPIQLPGRQDRILERPVESIKEMVKTLTDVLGDDLNQQRYAIYGHSAGALVAYTWAKYLLENKVQDPEYLIVGGFTAPYLSSPYLGVVRKVFSDCGFAGIPSVNDFIQQAKRYPAKIKKCMAKVSDVTGINLHEGFENQEFSDVLMPLLVADSKLVESFDVHNTSRLDIPIAALHGNDDDRVPILSMRAWKTLTTKSFSVKAFPGDHFFLHSDQSENAVVEHITDLIISINQEETCESV